MHLLSAPYIGTISQALPRVFFRHHGSPDDDGTRWRIYRLSKRRQYGHAERAQQHETHSLVIAYVIPIDSAPVDRDGSRIRWIVGHGWRNRYTGTF